MSLASRLGSRRAVARVQVRLVEADPALFADLDGPEQCAATAALA